MGEGVDPGQGGTRVPPAPAQRPKRRRRWRRRILLACLLLAVVLFAMHQHVVWSAAGHLYPEASVPAREAVIVLGARIGRDGPYPMLADRLRTAVALWRDGKAEKILLSGDGSSSPGYDEVAVMRRYVLDLDVPAGVLLEDRAGLRTLDSMYRARDAFGIESAIVVSNPFHVARAVFLGRQHGIDAVGVAAEHGARYSLGTLVRNRGREVAARIWAWLDVFVWGTEPEVTR